MADFFQQIYYGNTVQAWLISMLIVLFSSTLARAVYWIFSNTLKKATAKTATHLDDMLIDMVQKPLVWSLVLLGIWFALTLLVLPAGLDKAISNVVQFLIVMLVALLLARITEVVINEYIRPLIDNSDSDLDDHLLPLLQKGIKVVIWSMAIIIGLNNAGYDVAALLAGLGIGGIALAMAAKDTIANVFGGFTIFTDRPFKLGDRIKVAGYDGAVKEIGIRSTRLQTLEGRIVTIPNSKFAESPVENVSWEPTRKITLELGLTYDTAPESMDKALAILKAIADENPGVDEKVILFFSGFGASSLNITFIYYITKDYDIPQVQNEVNRAILKRFNEQGLAFAFPTQTIHLQQSC
ncbi:MAG: mechanosensitive ion channel family protein [Gammaproteobacteria bacterium]|nr:MAG: mechanosensitive ion channel family protein [Gammaproteobacteria bacterium]